MTHSTLQEDVTILNIHALSTKQTTWQNLTDCQGEIAESTLLQLETWISLYEECTDPEGRKLVSIYLNWIHQSDKINTYRILHLTEEYCSQSFMN